MLQGIDVDEAFIDLHKKILSTRDMNIRHASIEGDFSARRKLPATPSAITSGVWTVSCETVCMSSVKIIFVFYG